MADFELPGYEIYERLGRGGMATVYRALHLNLDREVAIKVMDASMSSDENFSERFIREARISARMIHPHILQIYDVNSFDGMNYIAMEYLSGSDLAGLIRGPLEQGLIYDLMLQMTEALDYAATHGYVHRDIKPSNIMLREERDFVLADFGIAKAADSGTQMTQTGMMVGTPSYMSPEQAKGTTVDGRSDLYSLGVLWYEMTTKTLPYDSDSAVSTAGKHLTEDIPTLPDELSAYQEFLSKALAKNADDRFQTGKEMFEALALHRNTFPADAVLVEPLPVDESDADADPEATFDPALTSAAFSQETRVSQSSSPRPSRPYKLSETSRERLSSGFHTAQRRKPQSQQSAGGALKAAVIAVVLAGAGFGGYLLWEQRGSGTASTEELRNVTAELAQAYSALNDNDINRAGIAFRKVLSIDSGNDAAKQGLSDVKAQFTTAIEQAIDDSEFSRADALLSDYGLLFDDSASLERLQSALALAQQEQELEAVQSERVKILLEKAVAAMENGKLFEPSVDNAYEYFMQVTALNASNSAARRGLNQLMTSAIAQAEDFIDENRFPEAREVINKARGIDPASPELIATQQAVESAEEAELKRENRWAAYSEERRDTLTRLLTTAEQQMQSQQFLSPEDGNAYQSVLSILELDPANANANRMLERMADSFLEVATQALEQQEFEQAETALASVSRVTPNHPELEASQAGLRSARQASEEAQARENYLASLLVDADARLASAATDLDAAADAQRLFEEALLRDEGNSAATEGLANTAQAYFDFARDAVKRGDFDNATSALASAAMLAPQRNDILNMQSQMADIEAAWQAQNSEEQLLADANVTAESGDYASAANAYREVMTRYPDSEAAQSGLDAALEGMSNSAAQAAASGRFDAASTLLETALGYDISLTAATDLQARLPEMEQQWRAAEEEKALALQQRNDLASAALAAISTGDLSSAQTAYDELAGLPDADEASQRVKRQLQDAYLLATRDELQNQAYDVAEELLLLGKALAPNLADWAELEVEIEIGKASSRRRLGEF